jgi:hypothetical protein
MQATNIEEHVQRITGLTDQEFAEVKGLGVLTENDLSFIQFDDYPETITLVKRRKLELLVRYLANGNALNATIDISGVREAMNAPPTAAVGKFDLEIFVLILVLLVFVDVTFQVLCLISRAFLIP